MKVKATYAQKGGMEFIHVNQRMEVEWSISLDVKDKIN